MLLLAERTKPLNISSMESTGFWRVLLEEEGGEEGRSPIPLFRRIQLGRRLVVLERAREPVVKKVRERRE